MPIFSNKNKFGVTRFLTTWMQEYSLIKKSLAKQKTEKQKGDDAPPRAELFGVSQLENHARFLASKHETLVVHKGEYLLSRLAKSESGIRHGYRIIAESVKRERQISPAEEWLLDNYHLLQEQIELTKSHLSPGYSRQLPRLMSGPRKNMPRIYDIILELVRHSDGQVDIDNLMRFIRAYQESSPLTLGELWAVPIMLRLTLIENMHWVAGRIAWRRRERDKALEWAERFLKVVEANPRRFVTTLGDFVRSTPALSSPFLTELVVNIDGVHPTLGLALNWLEQELAERGQTLEQVHQSENEAQAANLVTTRNSITSLRSLSALHWPDFVEAVSVMEAVLHRDPAGVYPSMDFRTRNRYRTQIERLSRYCGKAEHLIAEDVVAYAAERRRRGVERRESHIGYYLIDAGKKEFENHIKCKPPIITRLGRFFRARPKTLYFGSIAITTVLLFLIPFSFLSDSYSLWLKLFLSAFAIFTLTTPAISIVNWLFTWFMKPTSIPALDFSKSIPSEYKTMVVVPTFLGPPKSTAKLIEDIEVRYLANKSENLHFALLTDFPDAESETLPSDNVWIKTALAGIKDLNERYARNHEDIFFLLHRPRKWNKKDSIWMGFERKRGKLEAFNKLILEGDKKAFSVISGNVNIIRSVRFVITLDTDTQLPPASAVKMAGTLAHLLNRPQVHSSTHMVTSGYSILQPRLTVSLLSAKQSLFSRLYAGETGIDPYTREVSNVYQDLFGQGQYVGKGIYDVQAFHTATHGRFPDNRILSHDLIESCYARCGYLSEIELLEEEPSSFLADANRRHRWIRGDWQIASWLLPHVPRHGGNAVPNPLSMLSRWMIFDNLRRSMVPFFLLISLLLPCLFKTPLSFFWIPALLVAWFLPSIPRALRSLLLKSGDVPFSAHFRHTANAEARQWLIDIAQIVFLPYTAFLYGDAIVRTLWRLFSQNRLLEWRTAQVAERTAATTLYGFFKSMWTAPALSVAAVLFFTATPTTHLLISLCALWFVSPFIGWFLSRTISEKSSFLKPDDALFLRQLARRTWHFFENFVGPDSNWLPPDNYQEESVRAVANRTSPTNIGMAIGSELTALDFGYQSPGQMLFRITSILKTLESLERYRGHFYNWYDTQTLQPLHPRYVSTVDSGNLAGMLLVVREGLLENMRSKIIPESWRLGLKDTTDVILAEIENIQKENPKDVGNNQLYTVAMNLKKISTIITASGDEPKHILETLRETVSEASTLKEYIKDFDNIVSLLFALESQAKDFASEITGMTPWIADNNPLVPQGFSSDLSQKWQNEFSSIPTLEELATVYTRWQADLEKINSVEWINLLQRVSTQASERIAAIRDAADKCESIAEYDLDFLYDRQRHLLHIGYNVEIRKPDPGYYDLLASECRLASFLAVARGELPLEHWFHLGRRLASGSGRPVLVSWSGSMFEYLMPLLLMPTYENTLLHETYVGAVQRQIEYGRKKKIPWGISESGYNQQDVQQIYQYRPFGVPSLGLKRGLADDLVVAPYASVMSLMIAPEASAKNLMRMARKGLVGIFGFIEAIDYTPARIPSGISYSVVHSWMAHHSGMSLLALSYVLNGKPMQRRFLSSPQLKSAILLLQERIPLARPKIQATIAVSETASKKNELTPESITRTFSTPNTPMPEVHLLSNGRYHVMINNAGSGFSHWQNLALTRWREDAAQDDYGFFFYLKDVESGKFWSVTPQPSNTKTESYHATFAQGNASFQSVSNQIETRMQIAVCPEDDMELRQITISNLSHKPRTLELTSYAEIVLQDHKTDAMHPAFNKLFVQSVPELDKATVLFTRRPRSSEEKHPWLFHTLLVDGGTVLRGPTLETDRRAFLGRGRNRANPIALEHPGPLPNRKGHVLDSIAAIRYRVRIESGESLKINAFLGIANTYEDASTYIDRCRDLRMADRVFSLSWTRSQILLHQLRASEADVQSYARLAGSLLYAGPQRRSRGSIIAANKKTQAALWSYGISGDKPIVLLSITDISNLDLVKNLIQAHTYWRQKGLEVDLVIWSEAFAGYRQSLFDAILGMVQAGTEGRLLDQPGGIFVRNVDQIPEEDRTLFRAMARIELSDRYGSLADQIDRRVVSDLNIDKITPSSRPLADDMPIETAPRSDLVFYNGLGGFTHDGREYVIELPAQSATPAPWANVLANPFFGSVVSESGSMTTWSENAQQFRLTPWHNDPVSDPTGESFYIRDEETGEFWSPTPAPARGTGKYTCRHGHGYTAFEYEQNEVFTEMMTYVSTAAPLKFTTITLHNRSRSPKRISITGYCEWVLGDNRAQNSMHVVTRLDRQSGAIFAGNAFSLDYSKRVAFFSCESGGHSITGDRIEFVGRNGTLASPAALKRERLSNRVGAALDSCAAIMSQINLPPGEQTKITFILGCAHNEENARELLRRYGGTNGARQALEEVWLYWQKKLGGLYVETPDASVNFLVNHWLLYQVLSARYWGRAGFYQMSGAYGFRDQLQDSLAFLYESPWLTREHLLRASERQFVEGDVQHWWHPPVGRGSRTKISDDLLWLPFVLCKYVKITGDTGVLDEKTPFLDARLVAESEESYYDQPSVSSQIDTLYEHCVRAINHAKRTGRHGLPLMGSGDWNDGMNRIGIDGKGESVWMAFFLKYVLTEFSAIAEAKGDFSFASECREQAEKFIQNIEAHAWDGNWYLRAFFDNGTPLGTSSGPECKIDSLPQSWSVLAEGVDPKRSQEALKNAVEHLVDRKSRLVKLFNPPFDTAPWDPGYIKGYIPGIRENGGQYTHAAVWLAMALAKLRQADQAWDLFQIINPVRHGDTPERVKQYKIEPYVLAADVYSAKGHEGEGGWSWYTGSAAWLYQFLIESLLGINLEVNTLSFNPLLPKEWDGYKLTYRFHETFYHIELKSKGRTKIVVKRVWVDGKEQADKKIHLVNDKRERHCFVELG